MQIKLLNNEGEVFREANAAVTVLTAPSTISYQGKFFQLKRVPYQTVGTEKLEKFLVYRQCRGAFLADIEIAKGVEAIDW